MIAHLVLAAILIVQIIEYSTVGAPVAPDWLS